MKMKGILLVIFLLITTILTAEPVSTGTLKGIVYEMGLKHPVTGVTILVMGTSLTTITNEKGEFRIDNIPAGSYNIHILAKGYKTAVKTDIHIRPRRISDIKVELKVNSEYYNTAETVTVEASYFHKNDTEPHSAINLSAEEVRRTPGTAGDIGKMLKIFPGTVSITDQRNDLIVRGGSPTENTFFVDNIEIPNINQIPQLGSSGGLISIINPDFLQNVDFYTGGFSAVYGDCLSSVVNMTFREGNREEFDGQLDLNIGGFGAGFESPFANGKGSWLISGRRSYLDMVLKMLGKGFVPSYGDVHAKLTYNLSPKHQLTLLDIFGTSEITFEKEDSIDEGRATYGTNTTWQNTLGVNVLSLWNQKFFSNTSLSYSLIKNKNLTYKTTNDINNSDMDYIETDIALRNINYLTLNQRNKIQLGFSVKQELGNYDYFFTAFNNQIGSVVNGRMVQEDFSASKAGTHISYIWSPFNWLSATFGLRGDYFTFNNNFHLSPRFSLSWQVNPRLSLNGGWGIYYQTNPMFFLSQDTGSKELNDPKAVHYIAGLEYFLTPTTKLTLEVYNKEYSSQPIDPDYPYEFVIDRRAMNTVTFHDTLEDTGRGSSYGVELMIQKKLRDKFYGIISASYFRSRYKDHFGTWRDRMYDNRFLFSLVGGYKPDKNWELSVNWTYMGGAPYTPIDVEKSTLANEFIIDQTRVNENRFADYNSLNLRLERRFYLKGSCLIVYLDFWNVLNNNNVYMHYWDQINKTVGTRYQFSFLPVLGVEFEF